MAERAPLVMIMAGGTGGHVYPALAVAKHLEEKQIRTVWLGSRRGLENVIVPQHGIKLIRIFVSGLRGTRWSKWLTAPFVLLVAVSQSIVALIKERPGVVLGMGGFASGPGGLAAWLCRIPLVIHEQNARPGSTNRLLSRLATRVFQAFPGTFHGPNVETVGNPVRTELHENRKQSHASRGATINILVLGGSRGASYLNENVPPAISALCRDTQHEEIEIWHQCGERHLSKTQSSYLDVGLSARVTPFIDDMAAAYAWADVVICRAGAMTVSELMVVGVASVLVPFPFATDDHQTRNAEVLAKQDAAVIVAQGEAFVSRLASTLRDMLAAKDRLEQMGKRAHSNAVFDATTKVSDFCRELIHA